MSIRSVRAALETAAKGMSPAIETVLEGEEVTPASGSPYQLVHLLPADPDNTEYGPSFVERGILQITLRYPIAAGTADADARVDLIRSTFRRGASFVSGGIIVNITRTPAIARGLVDGDRWAVPVSITYHAHIIV